MTSECLYGYAEHRDGEMIRYSEMLSALSFVLDMVEGQPAGHVLRSCLVGMRVAERLGLDEESRSALFYALLLKDAGCSADASRVSAVFADDFAAKRARKTVNWSRLPGAALYAARSVEPDDSLWSRARRFALVGIEGLGAAREVIRIRCERGAEISRLMGFPEETARAIRGLDEHWDGAGHPDGLEGEEIPLLARICGLAQTVEVFFTAHGPERAEHVARVRRGRWFDPALVDVLLAEIREDGLWDALRTQDLPETISALEPPHGTVALTEERLDLTALAFARVIDAKSPFTFRHSERVAETAVAMGRRLGLTQSELRDQNRAGLLHDIGKLGVSNRILDKPGGLTGDEFARIKRHPALTAEALGRVTPFRPIVEIAASHHERLDGSGYHRGLKGEDLGLQARMLAVADVFDAMAQDRPYRTAMPLEQVLDILRRESGTRLCPYSVEALEGLIEVDELP
jgi:HD-GYP domain-containing protein (c-di-GMP phosphodiesterase class II)